MHLLIQCPFSHSIWTELVKWFKHSNINFIIDVRKILLNLYPEDIVNFIVLICKQYLYKTRCFRSKPNVTELFDVIREIKNIEYNIASNQNKTNKFNIKWQNINL